MKTQWKNAKRKTLTFKDEQRPLVNRRKIKQIGKRIGAERKQHENK